ncbi:MAG TPA: hypothetical protein VFZ48_03540 [Candidatus Saccharimonadales bacterium]
MIRERGYIALMAVLVVGAACLAIATTMLTMGVDTQRGVIISEQAAQARGLAHACGEEALQEINQSTTFTGTNTLTLGQGGCSYTVTNIAGLITIDAIGTVKNVVCKVKIYATITAQSISITSWQEIG